MKKVQNTAPNHNVQLFRHEFHCPCTRNTCNCHLYKTQSTEKATVRTRPRARNHLTISNPDTINFEENDKNKLNLSQAATQTI